MKAVLLLIGLVSGLVIGGVLWGRSDGQTTMHMQCRPTSPAMLPETQSILFWGNSLAFDHDWSLDEFQAVNCARQGLTAQTALSMTSQLPEIEFAVIVVVFGTVELVQSIKDVSEFGDAISEMGSRLNASYPSAKLVVLGVPDGSKDVWRYAGDTQTEEVNARLRGLENTIFVDTTTVLSSLSDSDQTYDGVHLTRASYAYLEREILRLINDS